jgi:hypothetical protein
MNRPQKYTAIHEQTGEIREFGHIWLRPYVFSGQPDRWTIYEDMRHAAKLRLYNYVTYTKQGREVPSYRPYAGTEIGKTIPILNF